MFRIFRNIVLLAASFGSFASNSAQACSCCGEKGDRLVYAISLKKYAQDVLAALSVEPEAMLIPYNNSIPELKLEEPWGFTFSIHLKKSPTKWEFNLRDDQGHQGSVTFHIPKSIDTFTVDPLPPGGKNDVLRDISLYKEWKMNSKVDGSGMFAKLNSNANHAELILRGNGGRCWGAEDFHTWMLNIDGTKSLVRLQGSLN